MNIVYLIEKEREKNTTVTTPDAEEE